MKNSRFIKSIKNFSLSVLDWVFPPACLGCGQEGVFICSKCFLDVNLIPANVCNTCGNFTSKKGFCPHCARYPVSYSGFRAFACYDGVIRKAIQQLKYHNDPGIGRYLAEFLLTTYQRTSWDADLIVPIPIGETKRELRGYNQSERLAEPLAEKLGLQYQPEALMRIHERSSQVGLSLDERRANIRDAFRARSKYVQSKNVLLVDDVFTSGATMEAASAEIIQAGANKVWCLTVAKVNHD